MQEDGHETCKLEIKSFISHIYQQQAVEASERPKQELLKVSIYDYYESNEQILNLFCEFMISYAHKVKGVTLEDPDLTIFTIEELQQIIESFKTNLSAIKAERQRQKKRERPKGTRSIIIDDECDEFKAKTFYKNMAWDYSLVLPAMQCNRDKPFFDNRSSTISIKFVNHFFKKNTGFFGMGREMVLWIEIQTVYLGRKVKVARTVDDFFFLQRTLQSIFPHSYIPPLRISKDDMKESTEPAIRKLISRCFTFLSKVSKREELLENVYAFRFLVEEKPNNYREHRTNNQDLCIDGFGSFKNIEGEVGVNVSEEAERMKKEYMNKSVHFQKIWRNISNLVHFANQSSKQLDEHIGKISEQLQLMTKQLETPICHEFLPLSKLISAFQGIIYAYRNTLRNSYATLTHLKEEFVDKSQANWQRFADYQERIITSSLRYQERRKEFLEGQALKLLEPMMEKGKISKTDLKIQLLNLEKNPLEEEWHVTETPWYGYLNHEFINTFQEFVKRDRNRLQSELIKLSPNLMAQMAEKGGSSMVHKYGKAY